MPLPYQGRPGIFDNASPTLIPNCYDSVMSVNGTLDAKSPAQFLIDNPRAAATATATIGGTVTAGNTVELTLTQSQLPGGSLSYTYTVLSGDTLASIAESLASGFNSAVRAAGGSALVTAIYATTGTDTTAHQEVVTINWDGPMGNFAVLSATLSGGATETVTIAPSGGGLTGGSGPVFCANNFNYSYGGVQLSLYYGKHYLFDGNLLAALARDDEPVV